MGPRLTAAVLLSLSLSAPIGQAMAFPTGVCPNLAVLPPVAGVAANAVDCTENITITDATVGAPLTMALVPANGGGTIAYDAGVEDVLVGVWNDSTGPLAAPVADIHIHGVGAFGFDGDGVSLWTGAPTDIFGYAGPNTMFSFSFGDTSQGDVIFNTPLLPGQTAYFSLEFPVSDGTVQGPPGGGGGQTGAPEPATLGLLGSALAGLGLLRRRR